MVSHAFGAAGTHGHHDQHRRARHRRQRHGTVTVSAAAAAARRRPSGSSLAPPPIRASPDYAGHGELKNGRALLTVRCSKAGSVRRGRQGDPRRQGRRQGAVRARRRPSRTLAVTPGEAVGRAPGRNRPGEAHQRPDRRSRPDAAEGGAAAVSARRRMRSRPRIALVLKGDPLDPPLLVGCALEAGDGARRDRLRGRPDRRRRPRAGTLR